MVDFLAAEVLAEGPASGPRADRADEHGRRGESGPGEGGHGPDADVVLDPAEASEAFVELRSDGSFRCHPLLRAAALAELAREPQGVAREARRRAAQWYVDRGETAKGSRAGDG